MDTDAYLRRQGWKGTGHSLDHRGTGIKKPLLISHKQDQLGLGKKKAAHSVDDQWWMRAFDESLQNIGTGQQSTLTQVRQQGINRGGLYGFFVKGESLVGTISNTEESSAAEASQSTSTPPSQASTPPTSASESSDDSESSSDSSDEIDCDTEMSVDDIVMAENEAGPIDGANPLKRKREGETKAEAKKRRKEERRPEVRARRKAEKAAVARSNAIKNKEKAKEEAIANGTYDPMVEKYELTMKRIDREVKWKTKERENAGEFGPTVPRQFGRKKGTPNLAFIEDPERPGKKLTYKAAKHKREKGARAAKKEMKIRLVVDAMMQGDLPNPNNYTREEAINNYEKDVKLKRKKQLKERKSIRERKKEEYDARKADKSAAKIARRQEKLKEREREREEKEAQEKAVIASKVAKLNEEEKTEYEERAAAKNQSLDEYILRRIQKKEEKTKAKAKQKERANGTAAEAPPLFFIDTAGDKNLLTKVEPQHIIDPEKLPYQRLPDGSIPLDPIVWEGRLVKSLSREEREARRKWMAQRRLDRKLRAKGITDGIMPAWLEQQGKTRAQKKHENINKLTGKLLLEEGVRSGATKGQVNEARRKAKRIMKEEKKERKKAGTFKLVQNRKGRHRVSDKMKKEHLEAVRAGRNAD